MRKYVSRALVVLCLAVVPGAVMAQDTEARQAQGQTQTPPQNQPVEVEDLRPRLRDVAVVDGHPQLLLRIGRAPEIPPAVRCPVEEVLID